MNNERDINEIARELAHNFSPEQLREKWEKQATNIRQGK